MELVSWHVPNADFRTNVGLVLTIREQFQGSGFHFLDRPWQYVVHPYLPIPGRAKVTTDILVPQEVHGYRDQWIGLRIGLLFLFSAARQDRNE